MIAADRPIPLDPSRVRGLVFDLDGTLVDSYRAIAESLNHARARFDLPPLDEATVRRSVGHGLERLIERHVGPGRVEEGVRLFREFYATVFAEHTHPLPGAEDSLCRLHAAGFRLAVASNKPARFTRPILEHLGLSDLVVSIHGPDSAGATKPDPAMIGLCLADMGLSRNEAAYVGDMVLDVESGERAGLPVILVPGGSSDAKTLKGTRRLVVDSLADVVTLLTDPRISRERAGFPR